MDRYVGKVGILSLQWNFPAFSFSCRHSSEPKDWGEGGGAHATAMGTAVPWAPEEEGKPLKTHFPLHKQEDFLLMHEPTGIQFNISRHTVPLRLNANGRHLHV